MPDADESSPAVITVVIADDHPTVRSGIRTDLGPPFTIVAEAGDADEALGAIEQHEPQLVVCDLNMPGGGGLRVVRETSARFG
jgi:DNA-binding NarL/FixJ family response regulator